MDVTIRNMLEHDWPGVSDVYANCIMTSEVVFGTRIPTQAAWDAAHRAGHSFVATDPDDQVVGWVAAGDARDQWAPAGVLEHGIYVAPGYQGRRIGHLLLDALIQSTERLGVWTVQAHVFPENLAALRLHERAGFRIVGTRERIEQHWGRWRDVLLIERRSMKN